MGDIPDVQEAVRTLDGVAYATVRWPHPGGPAYLRVEVAQNAGQADVTDRVLDTLLSVGGVDLDTIDLGLPDDAVRDREAAAADVTRQRPMFAGLTVDGPGNRPVVEVTIAWAGQIVRGRALSEGGEQARIEAAATATLAALADLLPDDVRLRLEGARVSAPSERRPALIGVIIGVTTDCGEELLAGTAFIRDASDAAAARAALDALNRRLGPLSDRRRRRQ